MSINAIQKVGSEAHDAARHDQLGVPAVRIQAGQEAQRQADQHRQQHGGDGQLEGRRQALDHQFHGRDVVDEAVAQVAVQRAVQEAQVLLPQRLVQAQLGDDAGAVHLVHVLADQDVHRIADGVQADEDDQRHQEHHHRGLRDAAQQPAGHLAVSVAAVAGAVCVRACVGAAAVAGCADTAEGGGAGVHSSPNTSGSENASMLA